jgi:para-aminobenzoate synthetase component 2
MVLLIDHFDSFVFNLARYFQELNQTVHVSRQDHIHLDEVERLQPSYIVLSPGPCSPKEAPVSQHIVARYRGKIPILGVCLGHQIIGEVYGGTITRARQPMHGQASLLHHEQRGLFRHVPQPCQVGRYHSLIVSETGLDPCLKILARSEENEIMAFASQTDLIAGVQFHPESILTEGGHQLLENFLACSLA